MFSTSAGRYRPLFSTSRSRTMSFVADEGAAFDCGFWQSTLRLKRSLRCFASSEPGACFGRYWTAFNSPSRLEFRLSRTQIGDIPPREVCPLAAVPAHPISHPHFARFTYDAAQYRSLPSTSRSRTFVRSLRKARLLSFALLFWAAPCHRSLPVLRAGGTDCLL